MAEPVTHVDLIAAIYIKRSSVLHALPCVFLLATIAALHCSGAC